MRRLQLPHLGRNTPTLLSISILFSTGLIAFAFHANHTVTFITRSLVAFRIFTSSSALLWFCAQVIPLTLFSISHHEANFTR